MLAELKANGMRIERKRVARLMRSAQLAGIRRAVARPRTTIVNETNLVAPILVARQLDVATPNQLWVGEPTDLPTGEGWVYLTITLDTCSRRRVPTECR